MRPIIRVDSLGKKYRLGGRENQFMTLRETLGNALMAPFRKSKIGGASRSTEKETIWALRDVSFDVLPGEIVGIVGRNGAGKSTLLKILSRITSPTEGQVDIYGRVGSLLEVGTGFNPELTGRDNIFLNGAILGMRRNEIERKFDEIVEFAEIAKFIDTPVKHYSSGMYMRLAFGVAAHLEPEILIVDEVLAVGDFSFQKKCIGKMSAVAREGRTVLFVSHNIVALRSLCTSGIWLENGTIAGMGDTDSVLNGYLQQNNDSRHERIWDDAGDESDALGNDGSIRLHSVRLISPIVIEGEKITVRDRLSLQFEYTNLVADALLQVSFVLYNLEGICILNGRSVPQRYPVGRIRQTCVIPENFLNDDSYSVRVVLVRDTNVGLLDLNNVISFDVHDVEREGAWYGKWIGVVRPHFSWTEEILDRSSS